MKIVIIKKNGYVSNVYSNEKKPLEAVELDLSLKEEAVNLPKRGWTDVSLCDLDVVVNKKFVEHVFDDEERNEELEKWQEKRKKRTNKSK